MTSRRLLVGALLLTAVAGVGGLVSLLGVGPASGAPTKTDGDGIWGPSYGPTPGPVVAVAIRPKNPQIVYAGTATVYEGGRIKSSGALYRTTDGGRRWIKNVDDGVNAVLIDPRDPAKVYVATQFDGVLKSTDGGRNWRAANAGLGDLEVAQLAIDPQRAETVYAGTGNGYGDGVFKSTDAGRRWRASGLADYFVEELAIDPRTPTSLYAAIWDPQFANDPKNRFARSTDGGRNWRVPEYGLRSIGSLAISATGPAIVYAGTSRGVVKSMDGGRRWKATGLRVSSGVSAVVIDPRKATTLYAATWRSGMFRSMNGGRSWSPFNQGLSTREISSLAIASNGRLLHAGTDVGVFDYRLPG